MRIPASVQATAALFILLIVPGAGAATPKACDLLSAQTAASLLGAPVTAPIDMQGMGFSYLTTTGSATVALTVVDQPTLTGANFTRTMQMSAGQGGTTESIPGLGEANFLVVRTAAPNSLMALYHHKMVSLAVQRKMTPELKAQMIQVMKEALAKI